jgi:Zn-dependent protease/CBS domain-containing protein
MFGPRIKLFTLFGFEVRLDASWLLLAALITWSLAMGLFPAQYPYLSIGTYWWMGLFGAAGLFASIVFHELSHSLVARRFNMPMKGITLFIFGGIAEMGDEPPNAKTEFLMAAAGPVSSVILGFVFYALARAGENAWPLGAVGVLAYLAWINWILAAFNLIPAFPLDGGRILRAGLWHWQHNLTRATRITSTIGGAFGMLLMIGAVIPLFSGNLLGAIWWFLIGMFLRSAAQMSYQQLVIRQVLQGEKVRRFMKRDPITAPPETSVEKLVDDYVYRFHHKMFPVVGAGGELLGCVSTQQIKNVPREEWERRRVGEVVQPCDAGNTVTPDTDATTLLSMLNKTGRSRVLVVEGSRLAGIVSAKDIVQFLATKLELEGDVAAGVSVAKDPSEPDLEELDSERRHHEPQPR